MSDYRMIGGMFTFVLIVIAVLASAGAEYPEVAPTNPTGVWPPVFPQFTTPDWGNRDAEKECQGSIVYEMCVLSRWIAILFGVIVGGLVFVVNILVYIVDMFKGLASFRIPGLPPELEFISTVLIVVFAVLIALLVFRLIRSVIPFVSGE